MSHRRNGRGHSIASVTFLLKTHDWAWSPGHTTWAPADGIHRELVATIWLGHGKASHRKIEELCQTEEMKDLQRLSVARHWHWTWSPWLQRSLRGSWHNLNGSRHQGWFPDSEGCVVSYNRRSLCVGSTHWRIWGGLGGASGESLTLKWFRKRSSHYCTCNLKSVHDDKVIFFHFPSKGGGATGYLIRSQETRA